MRPAAAAAAAKSLQSCLTLCDPIDGSPPGSPVPGILQARILEQVAISFFNAWKWKVTVKSLSRARLLVTPWTAPHQAPLSMGFSRQEYWSGVPLPSLYMRPAPSNVAMLWTTPWCLVLSFTVSWLCCLPWPWRHVSFYSLDVDCHDERWGHSFILGRSAHTKAKTCEPWMRVSETGMP